MHLLIRIHLINEGGTVDIPCRQRAWVDEYAGPWSGTDGQATGTRCGPPASRSGATRPPRPILERPAHGLQRRAVDSAHRCALTRLARPIRPAPDRPSALPELGTHGCDRKDPPGSGRPPPRHRGLGPHRMFCGRDIRSGQKGGGAWSQNAKRGKGTKIMGISDSEGLPLALRAESATPAEVKLCRGHA